MSCANTHKRVSGGSSPTGSRTPASQHQYDNFPPLSQVQCFKNPAEYVAPVEPELLPSAAHSARDFFINGKDQSLKPVERSFYGSAGMDGVGLSLPGSGSGRKTFP